MLIDLNFRHTHKHTHMHTTEKERDRQYRKVMTETIGERERD